MKTTYTVNHNEPLSRFEVRSGESTAVLDYHLADGAIIFMHTGVPAELEGRGIGSELVKAGLAYASAKKLKVASLCWFVDKYMQRHPDWNTAS